MMRKKLLVAAAILAVLPLTISVQTTLAINPTILQYDASVDHDRLGLDDTPLLTKYEMRIYHESTSSLVRTVDLGKPAPVSGVIRVTTAQLATLFSGLQLNTRYVARVASVGPSGMQESDVSNPFGFSGPPAAPGGKPVITK